MGVDDHAADRGDHELDVPRRGVVPPTVTRAMEATSAALMVAVICTVEAVIYSFSASYGATVKSTICGPANCR